MPSNHTEHYGLSQWERTDKVQMEDFNADNAKIDAALGALAAGQLRLHTGSYQGTGETTLNLAFPFKPALLWIYRCGGFGDRLVMAGETFLVMSTMLDNLYCVLNGDGFTASFNENTLILEGWRPDASDKSAMAMNAKPHSYLYIAIG